MKKLTLILGLAMVGSILFADQAQAQYNDMTPTTHAGTRSTYPRPLQAFRYSLRDPYSPQARYAYSRNGIDAQRTHEWNVQQAQSNSWHGNYNYWRWQRPTALVVPPTASYETQYNWGVAQTRSEPIYHQFGRDNAGTIIQGADQGGYGFSNTPYWPSSTRQFGVYPVRAPWHH